jgi:hypothetical protein
MGTAKTFCGSVAANPRRLRGASTPLGDSLVL